jgi:predicted Zn-dependent peptidase
VGVAGAGAHRCSPDAAALLQQLLLGGGSRLHALLHDELHAGYALRGRLLQCSDAGALYFGLSFDHSTSAARAIAAVERALDAITAHGFSAQAFARAGQALAARGIVEADRLDERLESLAQRSLHPRGELARTANLAELNECVRQAWARRACLRWGGLGAPAV